MTIFLAFLGVLVPASVTLVGLLFKRASDNRTQMEKQNEQDRLQQEAAQEAKRLQMQKEDADNTLRMKQEQEENRLRLDAAMRAADLFGSSQNTVGNASRSASGLLALTRLGFAELAVALLVDLWNPLPLTMPPDQVNDAAPYCVSTELAIQVINAALKTCEPDVQLMAAQLLCKNACSLDINNFLHWPSSVNGVWIDSLPMAANLLVVDALVHSALASSETKNSLRELAVRLYGISVGESDYHVKNCVGVLLNAIMPAVGKLGYRKFMRGSESGFVTLDEMQDAASHHEVNPDGHLEAIVKQRAEQLAAWSSMCTIPLSATAGALAPASCAVAALPA
jgi:hypothetical protein